MKIRYIICKNGERVAVDAPMFEFLNTVKWRVGTKGYAITSHPKMTGKKNSTISMHRIVASTPPEMWTDHKNGNKLDNRRKNLRVCTPSQNNANRVRKYHNRFAKSVRKVGERFHAQICGSHIGSFANEKDASVAYGKMAKKMFGEYAKV